MLINNDGLKQIIVELVVTSFVRNSAEQLKRCLRIYKCFSIYFRDFGWQHCMKTDFSHMHLA